MTYLVLKDLSICFNFRLDEVPESPVGEVLLGPEGRGCGRQDPVDDRLHLQTPLDLTAGKVQVGLGELLPVGGAEHLDHERLDDHSFFIFFHSSMIHTS